MFSQQAARLRNYSYLFFLDIMGLPNKIGLDTYKDRESGYIEAMMHAYIYAFSQKNTGKLSLELLQGIHARSASHLKHSDLVPGSFKRESNKFSIYPSFITKNVTNSTYSYTVDGLVQMMRYWMYQRESQLVILDVSENGSIAYWEGKVIHISSNEQKIIDPKAIVPFVQQLNAACSLMTLCSMSLVEDSDINKVVIEELKSVISSFENEMPWAITDFDKIKIIVKHVQLINQLHVFADCNIRTCNILLNKLLNDYGLGLTLLSNPNIFDGWSVDEIAYDVIEGQRWFNEVIAGKDANIKLQFSHMYHFIPQQEITLLPNAMSDIDEQLQKQFVDSMIAVAKPKSENQIGLFSESNKPTVNVRQQLIKKIKRDYKETVSGLLNLLENDKFGVLLRKFCLMHDFAAVHMLLNPKYGLNIAINDASSNGNTALDWVMQSPNDTNEKKSLERLLLSRGALRGAKINPAAQKSS